MGKTNTLTSHHPERTSNRIDKMNTPAKNKFKRSNWNKLKKKMSSKKRRNLLKHSNENKI